MDKQSELKKFLSHFKILFGFVFVIAVFFVIMYFARSRKAEEFANNHYASPNTERVYGDRRVFDFADKLSDEEESRLTKYIHEAEYELMTDIVIVTLNQSLADYEPEYMANYTIPITPDKYVMVFADKFWEDNRFGYDAPQILDGTTATGDGVILVDNLFREPETNKIYTWMGTTGIVEEKFSSSMIDYCLDEFYEDVDYNYYEACIAFVDEYKYWMEPSGISVPRIGHFFAWFVAVIIFLIYFFTKRRESLGTDTTTNETYLIGNTLEFTENKDVFLRKETSRVYDPPSSSSSGGGGHHSSGGGGSHGGGGHSR